MVVGEKVVYDNQICTVVWVYENGNCELKLDDYTYKLVRLEEVLEVDTTED